MRMIFMLFFLAVSFFINAQTNYFITSEDGTKLYVRELGTGDPVVILAGGPGLNAVYLEGVYKKLSEKYRCIVMDQRGTGKSLVGTVDSLTMDMKNYVNDLEALRKHLNL